MRQVIDVHTHIFSLLCLPLEGIIRELADEDDGFCLLKPVKAAAAKALTPLLNLLALSARTRPELLGPDWPSKVNGARNLNAIAEMLTDLLLNELQTRRSLKADPAAAANEELVSAVGDLLAVAGFGKVWGEMQSLHKSRMPLVRDLKGALFVSALRRAVRRALGRLFRSGRQALSQARFLLMLLLPEEALAGSLLAAYDDLSAEASVEHFVPLMMDMELAYARYHGEPPVFDFETRQIPVMGKVLKANSPRLLGFVAFDPRRSRLADGTADPCAPLAIVRKGLAAGNIGVKYYPSMGYHPDMTGFAAEHKALFEHCAQAGVPVMTHCQWGAFKADNDWDTYADPANWTTTLQTYKGLRVCFGHAGGGIQKVKNAGTVWGWFSATDSQWNSPASYAKKVIGLCRHLEGAYCDLSIFSEFMDGYASRPDRKPGCLSAKEARRIFQDRLVKLLLETPALGKKIMYGSDWHMPSMLGRPSRYLRIMMDMFDHPDLRMHADDFFYNNALRYLGLPSATP